MRPAASATCLYFRFSLTPGISQPSASRTFLRRRSIYLFCVSSRFKFFVSLLQRRHQPTCFCASCVIFLHFRTSSIFFLFQILIKNFFNLIIVDENKANFVFELVSPSHCEQTANCSFFWEGKKLKNQFVFISGSLLLMSLF